MLTALDSTDFNLIWRLISSVTLLCMAIRFGRTLQSGCVPLIEQIARVSAVQLTADLVRYQKILTAIWCAYLVLSSLFVLISTPTLAVGGALIGLCSVLLFWGEHWLRPYFFTTEKFPSLMCQLRDTIQVFRRGTHAKSSLKSEGP